MSASQNNALLKRSWNVQASWGALNTSNPIREIIETMNLAENPDKKVIPLSIGDPTIFGNLKPCKEILDALHRANSSGKYYGYQTAAGMEAAREAVVEYHYKSTKNRVKRQDVILASGCSHAIDLCICVLARPGQNILIPRPGFPLYKTLTSVYGVRYKQYNLLAEKNWSIDLRHLESLIDADTAAIVVNNPSNPCGSVFDCEHILQLLDLAERYKLPIIADEIYDKFVFSEQFYTKGSECHKKPPLTDLRYEAYNNEENRNPSNNSKSASNTTKDQRQRCQLDSKRSDGEAEDSSDYGDLCDSEIDGSIVSLVSDEFRSKTTSPVFSSDTGDEDDSHGQGDHHNGGDNEASYVPFIPISSLSKTVPVLTCGGISKTCLIPGLRLGWIIINDRQNIFDASVRIGLNRLTQRLMGPNSLVQGALHDILTIVPEEFYSQTMDFIYKNAKLCYERLRLVKGLQPHMPQGSMYLMVRFDYKAFPDINGDLDFTSKLMNEESVLVLPGKCFDFPNYFRICLTVPTNVMEEALDRMREFCERHHFKSSSYTGKANKYTNHSLVSKYAHNETPLMKLNLSSTNNVNGQQTNKCK